MVITIDPDAQRTERRCADGGHRLMAQRAKAAEQLAVLFVTFLGSDPAKNNSRKGLWAVLASPVPRYDSPGRNGDFPISLRPYAWAIRTPPVQWRSKPT
jgi:hypothetical protein